MEKNNQVDNAKDVTVTQVFLSSVVATLHIQPEGKERLYEEGDLGSESKGFVIFIYTNFFPPVVHTEIQEQHCSSESYFRIPDVLLTFGYKLKHWCAGKLGSLGGEWGTLLVAPAGFRGVNTATWVDYTLPT